MIWETLGLDFFFFFWLVQSHSINQKSDSTWLRCTHFSFSGLSADALSDTIKISAVVGTPGRTATKSWFSLIPVTFNNKISLEKSIFYDSIRGGSLELSVQMSKYLLLSASHIICLNTSHCQDLMLKSRGNCKFYLTAFGKGQGF